MTAPVRSILPADKQREHDEALVAFWNDGSARTLYALENWATGANTGRSMPNKLEWVTEYSVPFWRATHEVEGEVIEGEMPSASSALDDMLDQIEATVAEFAQERYEDNMAGRG